MPDCYKKTRTVADAFRTFGVTVCFLRQPAATASATQQEQLHRFLWIFRATFRFISVRSRFPPLSAVAARGIPRGAEGPLPRDAYRACRQAAASGHASHVRHVTEGQPVSLPTSLAIASISLKYTQRAQRASRIKLPGPPWRTLHRTQHTFTVINHHTPTHRHRPSCAQCTTYKRHLSASRRLHRGLGLLLQQVVLFVQRLCRVGLAFLNATNGHIAAATVKSVKSPSGELGLSQGTASGGQSECTV